MNSKKWAPFLILFALIFFYTQAQSQNQEATSEKFDPPKTHLINYLNALDGFVNEPDSFFFNRHKVLNYFDSKRSKRVYYFLSPKKRKGHICADSLLNHIVMYYPEGLGMAYNSDEITRVGLKKSFGPNTFVYKTPVEFSGFNWQGELTSISEDQFFYVKSGSKKTSLTRISNKNYFDKKFKRNLNKQGLFVELHTNIFSLTDINGYSEREVLYETVQIDDDWGGSHSQEVLKSHYEYWSSGDVASLNNFSGKVIYMFTPFVGLGTGYSNYKQVGEFRIIYGNYNLPETLGYIPTLYTGTTGLYSETGNDWQHYYLDELEHRIEISSHSYPVFLRLQLGNRITSFSLDLGFGALSKPLYKSYLYGTVRYFGISTETGQLVTNNPTLGFGTFTYDDELVSQSRATERKVYGFYRLNMSVQPNQYFYFWISSGFQAPVELEYNESWHMYDMYALNLPKESFPLEHHTFSVDFGVGFNINSLFLR